LYSGGVKVAEMRKLDKFEQIAADAQYVFAVLANTDTDDVQFVDLDLCPVPRDAARAYSERGLAFVGVVGWVKGRPSVALDVELDSETIQRMTGAFVAYVRKLTAAKWTVRPDMNAN